MQINKLLKYLRKSKSASGFTLTELLVSSFMGALVIGATGYALTNMLQGNKTATAQTNKRTEINRAMEFISDEIKRADTIDVDPATAFAAIPNPPSGAQPILALNIPGVRNPATAPGVASPIIYFVSDPRDADTSVWKGPKVIYRFGPPLDTDGEYTKGAWLLEPLVDGISDDTATVACDTGETASPSDGALGFYACIVPTTDDPTKGETAKIFAIGKRKLNDSNNSKYEYYQADTQVFARAEQEVLDGKDTDEQFDAACNFVSGALTCPGGKKRYTVKTLANNFACKDANNNNLWDVEFAVYEIDPITNKPKTDKLEPIEGGVYESEAQLVFEVKPDPASQYCQANDPIKPFTPMSLYTSETAPSPNLVGKPDPNSGQQNQSPVFSNDDNPSIRFKQLEDGDPIEANLLKAGYKSQKSTIDNFKDPNDDKDQSDSLIDPTDNTKINIEAGRYIVAFEMGQVDASQPGFDFQDQILSIQVANAP